MHPPETRAQILRLVERKANDCEIARRLGLPRTTVRDIRNPRDRKTPAAVCPRCGKPSRPIVLAANSYSELLGLYLGDGHITSLARTDRLRLSLDPRHMRIVMRATDVLRDMFPENKLGVTFFKDGRVLVLHLYSQHLRCLFPHAGAGKKHHRRIVLADWQEDYAGAAPWALLRGLINSDGCSFVNRTGPYEYLSYEFANRSQDILSIFARAADLVGVDYRRYRYSIRIYRRASVSLLVEHVGVKS